MLRNAYVHAHHKKNVKTDVRNARINDYDGQKDTFKTKTDTQKIRKMLTLRKPEEDDQENTALFTIQAVPTNQQQS